MSSHGRLSKEVVGSDVLLWRDHPGTCETLGRKAWAMSMKFHWINKEVWQRETHTHPSLSLVKMTNSDSWGVAYLGQAELASWASQMEYPQAVLFSQFIYLLIFFFFESSQFIIHWIGSCRAFFSFVFIYSLLSSFLPSPPLPRTTENHSDMFGVCLFFCKCPWSYEYIFNLYKCYSA